MAESYKVLVVDDEESILKLLSKELSSPERIVQTANCAKTAREMVRKERYEVIISDIRLPDGDGLELLTEFKDMEPDVEVILITGHGNIDNAVEAIRIGAYDYITKPFRLDRVELVVDRAWQRVCLTRENRSYRHSQQCETASSQLIGSSSPIKQIRHLINKVAPTNVPVLITGESGAGKDVVAHAIHCASQRSAKPMIVKNCATLQKELSRSELFGHTKGSFTGATENCDGLMTFAHTGTLFLDEIGELPMEVQASLLRVLESHTFRRVGEKDERTVDIRFLFATNRNLAKEVEEGRFHEALFHRINVFNISLPELKDRREDVPLLIDFFINKLGFQMGQGEYTISERAMQCMLSYHWPGNVRELRNVLERSIILADNNTITCSCLPKEIADQPEREGEAGILSLERMEREHIIKALDFFNGNRQKAAQALGIGRKTLYRKIDKYNL
ncbi:sigma-54-dependent transcriptional regulator [Maridesulfovibrio salexigens]|uniref:Two component, sigma54 specific, transcriptional regulator, Fis family n=1 Tax=Maridesulfovibrio salexigens (strain ATCC 14822 / DSM 2638 / NCIMB 8403 / VKM B-1763) TaxID=526222 RepID=C6BWB0_MARSD|nr:sigma-54 dependent transcriptional regulator [Maridesulfovibrio salexigens]ACS78354.1 two component, sigma54 specific, transcriptional regulator, Fis family [Maridesulfovibrio salexigens DSM 2638]